MEKIFNNNKPKKSLSRNGFDNSCTRVLDMRPAVVRPVNFIHTVPNAAYKISVSDIVRTDSLQQAAFLSGKQELDVFFVPYSQLYSRSNDVIFAKGELDRVSVSHLDSKEFPHFSLCSLINIATYPYLVLRFGKWFYNSLKEYVDSLDGLSGNISSTFSYYPVLRNLFAAFFSDPIGNGLNLEQFFYHFDSILYFNPNGLTIKRDDLFNLVNGINTSDYIGSDSLALLSTCGYGDYYTQIKAIIDKCIDSGNEVSLDPGVSHSESEMTQILGTRIDNFIGTFISLYYSSFLYEIDNDWDVNLNNGSRFVNLLNLFAYQKVWRDVYRDSVNDDSLFYAYASNMDYDFANIIIHPGTPHNPSEINNFYPLMTFLRPRLRMMRKDLSCGLYGSTQEGVAARGSELPELDIVSSSLDPNHSDSAVAIKFALAMQRYRQMLMRAGNRTKDLLNAEFGVKSQFVDDVYCRHIGSFDGRLDINKVSATTESQNYSVGDVAANIFSSLSGDIIEFTSNDHGILVFAFSFITDPLHSAFGVDPFNYKFSELHFFKEDFDNLGLSPVTSTIFGQFYRNNSGQVVNDEFTLGFAARYFEYKTKIDTVHDTFVGSTIIPESPDTIHGISVPSGVNNNFVTTRNVAQTLSVLKDRSYLLPSCMDEIFTSLDDGSLDNAHFHCALQFNVSAILPMSVLGLI